MITQGIICGTRENFDLKYNHEVEKINAEEVYVDKKNKRLIILVPTQEEVDEIIGKKE